MGSALVLDSATGQVITPQKWKIDGVVFDAVPDGKGGFYVGGDFTRIGDSTRKYIAQIDSTGKPTAWYPQVDSVVKKMVKRNDTLFVGGFFIKFASRFSPGLALYSLSADTLINKKGLLGSAGAGGVNTFLFQRDTIIVARNGSYGSSSIRKYCYAKDSLLPWQPVIYGEVNTLEFSSDSSLLIFSLKYENKAIKSIHTASGALKYEFSLLVGGAVTTGYRVYGMKTVGKKTYVVGYFNRVAPVQGGVYDRIGFFAFDGMTGAILADDIKANGYSTFLAEKYGQLIVSGDFTKVNNIDRKNFAVIDTANLSLGTLQFDPSDPLTTYASGNGRTFIAGYFNGIYATKRNGFAIVDSATNAILPSTIANTQFREGRRMFILGDTLFILGITARPSTCMVNDYRTRLEIYSLTTGLPIQHNISYTRMDDILVDSGYLYASFDQQLRRFHLPTLIQDPSWGVWYSTNVFTPIRLLIKGNEVLSIADNRFDLSCTFLRDRKGWLLFFDKSTGHPKKGYSYQGDDPVYHTTVFDHALLDGNKLYVQGFFRKLNGKDRVNFACIDINTGELTDWRPTLPGVSSEFFHRTTDLKFFNGKLSFGGSTATMANGKRFSGLGANDTTTAALTPSLASFASTNYRSYEGLQSYDNKHTNVADFAFHGSDLLVSGSFIDINGWRTPNMGRLKLVPATTPTFESNSAIVGADTLYMNADSSRYYLPAMHPYVYSYNWTYSGTGVDIKNNGSDTVWLKAGSSATSGQLTVTKTNFCGLAASRTKVIQVLPMPAPPPVPTIAGLIDQCQHSVTAKAKLLNPPLTGVSILVDGATVNYQPNDSSFVYFTNGATSLGNHNIRVSYQNAAGSRHKDSSFRVLATAAPSVSITTPSLTPCLGAAVTFTATHTNTGTTPSFEWQVNGVPASTANTFTTNTLAGTEQVKLLLTSSLACSSPQIVTSNVINMNVRQPVLLSAVLSGNATVLQGQSTTITATVSNGGASPVFRWQDSTANRTWTNITGANSATLLYSPGQTGDKIRCLITSNHLCVSPTTLTSDEIGFVVNTVTALPSVNALNQAIHIYPNPVQSMFVVDSLLNIDGWQKLEIFSASMQKTTLEKSIKGQTKVTFYVNALPAGVYYTVLTNKQGKKAYLRFIKI